MSKNTGWRWWDTFSILPCLLNLHRELSLDGQYWCLTLSSFNMMLSYRETITAFFIFSTASLWSFAAFTLDATFELIALPLFPCNFLCWSLSDDPSYHQLVFRLVTRFLSIHPVDLVKQFHTSYRHSWCTQFYLLCYTWSLYQDVSARTVFLSCSYQTFLSVLLSSPHTSCNYHATITHAIYIFHFIIIFGVSISKKICVLESYSFRSVEDILHFFLNSTTGLSKNSFSISFYFGFVLFEFFANFFHYCKCNGLV